MLSVRVLITLLAVVLAACGSALTSPQLLESVKSESSTGLCYDYGRYDVALSYKQLIELELISRGENTCAGSNLGAASLPAYGHAKYSRSAKKAVTTNRATENSGQTAGVDCADFNSGVAAQRYFLTSGGPTADAHNLDGDGDGLACEWGHQLRKIYNHRAPRTSRPARTYSSSACHTGPRGGTYTIGAGGRKNYGAC